MGLKITRTANPARLEKWSLPSLGMAVEDLSSLMSARHAYRLKSNDDSRGRRPSVLEKLVPDGEGHMDAQSIGELFKRLWAVVRRNRDADVVLDMSEITSVASRFTRELVFLRSHLIRQNRRVLLSHVRPECSHLWDVA